MKLSLTIETLKENLIFRNESMCAIHANYLKGNRRKMLRLNENGLWLATPLAVTYDREYNATIHNLIPNTTLEDSSGNLFNLEMMLLAHTIWGKCNKYKQL
jgi:hypothetical protein